MGCLRGSKVYLYFIFVPRPGPRCPRVRVSLGTSERLGGGDAMFLDSSPFT